MRLHLSLMMSVLCLAPAQAQTVSVSRAGSSSFVPGFVPASSGASELSSFATNLTPLAPSLNGLLPAPSLSPATFPAALKAAPVAFIPSALAVATLHAAAVPVIGKTAVAKAVAEIETPSALALHTLAAAATPDDQNADDVSRFSQSGRLFDGEGMLRPLVESWRVDGRKYKSTEELVKNLPLTAGPVEAKFIFSHTIEIEKGRPVANAAIGTFAGGIFGSITGVILYSLGSAFTDFADAIFLQPGSASSWSDTIFLALSMGVLGAIIGAVSFYRASRKPVAPKAEISGLIYRIAGPQGDTLYFERSGERHGGLVDLGAFAKAPTTPAPAVPAKWPAWKRALIGLGVGLALAAAYFIPLVNVAAFFMVPVFIGKVFAAKLAGTGIEGGALGAALGMLATVAALFTYGAEAFAAIGLFGGVMAAVGLVLGLIAANSYRAARAAEKASYPDGQWWSGTF